MCRVSLVFLSLKLNNSDNFYIFPNCMYLVTYYFLSQIIIVKFIIKEAAKLLKNVYVYVIKLNKVLVWKKRILSIIFTKVLNKVI